MDQNAPEEGVEQKPLKRRAVLNALALCFALSVLGRGLGGEFYRLSQADLGKLRLGVAYRGGPGCSLAALAGGLGIAPIRPAVDRSGPRMVIRSECRWAGRSYCGLCPASLAFPRLRLCVGLESPLSATFRIPSCGRWLARGCRPRWPILYCDRSRRLDPAAGVASPDRSFGGAAPIKFLAAPRCYCCCRCWYCHGGCSPPARRTLPRVPMPTSPTKAGPCQARCATTHSGLVLNVLLHRDRNVCNISASRRLSDRCRDSRPWRQRPPGVSAASHPVRNAGRQWLDGIIGRRPAVLFSYALSIAGILMLWGRTVSKHLAAERICLLWQHDRLTCPLLTATAMKIFRGKKGVATIYGAIAIGSGLGIGVRLLERRTDPRLDPQLYNRDRWLAWCWG